MVGADMDGRRRRRRVRRETPIERLRDRLARPSGERDDQLVDGIAGQVAEQRLARALSQQELAELCATTQPAIARLESGTHVPRLDTLRRIADALDCELVVRLRPRTRPRGKAADGGDQG
jgi:ribosome-binding protein aMBF1 (putative translation factor)